MEISPGRPEPIQTPPGEIPDGRGISATQSGDTILLHHAPINRSHMRERFASALELRARLPRLPARRVG